LATPSVHQFHLAKGVDDISGLGDLRQVVEERRLFQVDVERVHGAVLEQQEFAQQARDQGLADLRTG
jgi:hypothetical protein